METLLVILNGIGDSILDDIHFLIEMLFNPIDSLLKSIDTSIKMGRLLRYSSFDELFEVSK